MLTVKNIEKSFGEKKVLDGISLTVNKGMLLLFWDHLGQERQLF